MPSPHAGIVQFELHVSVSTPLESHCSPAATLTMPSPHTGSVQFALHVAVATPPESHASPAAVFVMSSPQTGAVQFALHVAESPAVSQISVPLPSSWTLPSPQVATLHWFVQSS